MAHSCSMIHTIKNKIDLTIKIQRILPLNYFKLELVREGQGEIKLVLAKTKAI